MCNDVMDGSRRDLLKLTALLGLSSALPLLRTAPARAATDQNAPLRIGYLPITDAAPLLVAHQRGLLQASGLTVETPRMFRSWAQLVEAFISGQVNVVHLLSPMTVWARFGSKVPAKVVAWNHVNGSALTVLPEIDKLSQLAGKTIAVPFWYSIHNVVVQELLRQNGLTPVLRADKLTDKQVKLVVMAPADMAPALASRQIAGYIVAEPFDAAAEALKVGKVLRFTGDLWKNHACCVVFMHERDLTERPEWSDKVVSAIVKAQLWTRQHGDEAAKLLSKEGDNHYTPHTVDVLRRVLAPSEAESALYLKSGAVQHADWKEKRIDFQPYPFPSYTEELVKRMKSTAIEGDATFLAKLDPKQAARELVDDRFVKRALAAVGGLTAFGLPESFVRSETLTFSS
jgi:NitT/TauT family transport system substrate-binding protein